MPTNPPHIEVAIPWDLVETQLEHHGTAGQIFYSKETTWWSHLRGHALFNGPEMRCPLGTQIYAEKDWRGWLAEARDDPSHYGEHGLRALLAAHHANSRSPEGGGPYAARSWRPINLALTALDAELAALSREKPKPVDLRAPPKRAFVNAGRRR